MSGLKEDIIIKGSETMKSEESETETETEAPAGNRDGTELPASTATGGSECRDRIRQFIEFHLPSPMPPALLRGSHFTGFRPNHVSGVPGAHAIVNPMYREPLGPTSLINPSTIDEVAAAEEEVHTPAELVDDQEDRTPEAPQVDTTTEIFDGKLEVKQDSSHNNNTWLALLLIFTAGLVLVILLPFLILNKSSDTKGLRSTPSETNLTGPIQSSPTLPFQDDLSLAVLDAIQDEVGGSFWKANQWLLADPSFHDYSPDRQRQRFYLALVYYATNGDTTWIQKDHWLSYNVSECQWFSKSTFDASSKYYLPDICDENNTVINLSLANNNLTGTLPAFFTDFLPQLKVFDLGDNHIGGQIPKFIATPYLEVLIYAHNLFEGHYILNAGAYWDNLKVAKIQGTNIEGNYMGAANYIMPKLEVFNMTGHPNGGEIWSSLGVLTNLEYLGYGHRDTLHGTIPTELGKLTVLKELQLASLPSVEGTIPSELGLLTELTKLDLSGTPLTGTVPAGICHNVAQRGLELLAECNGDGLECCNSP